MKDLEDIQLQMSELCHKLAMANRVIENQEDNRECALKNIIWYAEHKNNDFLEAAIGHLSKDPADSDMWLQAFHKALNDG